MSQFGPKEAYSVPEPLDSYSAFEVATEMPPLPLDVWREVISHEKCFRDNATSNHMMAYDGPGRLGLELTIYPHSSPHAMENTYHYDDEGQLAHIGHFVERAVGKYHPRDYQQRLHYDESSSHNLLLVETLVDLPEQEKQQLLSTRSLHYDDADRLIGEKLITRGKVSYYANYQYDDKDRLQSTKNPQEITLYNYDQGGKLLSSETFPSQRIKAYHYDRRSRLVGTDTHYGRGPIIETETYRYDRHGRIKKREYTEYFPSGGKKVVYKDKLHYR